MTRVSHLSLGLFLLRALRESLPCLLASRGLLGIFGVSWLVEASPDLCFVFIWCSSCVCLSLHMAFFQQEYSHIGLGLFHYDLILTTCIYNNLTSKSGHILRHWGLGLQHIFLEGIQFHPQQIGSVISYFSFSWHRQIKCSPLLNGNKCFDYHLNVSYIFIQHLK